MFNKIQLTIPTPCHENWENMSPAEKGRFCGSCQKEVLDFSSMTDNELAQFFKKPSGSSVCGRFMNEQLNREIEIPKKRIPWLKYFFQMALPALFFSKASAQTKIGKAVVDKTDTTKTRITGDNRMLGMVLPVNFLERKGDTVIIENPITKITIKGTVRNEKKEIVAFASIIEKSTGNMVVANEKGEFSFNTKNSKTSLLVSSSGYETKEVNITANDVTMEIILRSDASANDVDNTSSGGYVKGEVIAEDANRGPVKNQPPVVTTDEVIERDVEVPAERNRFYIFPNPIKSGGYVSAGIHSLEEGYYSVQFSALSGQLIQQKEIWIDESARVLNLDAPVAAAGTYFITLINKKTGKKFSQKIIIQ
jgi:hypothetical protein